MRTIALFLFVFFQISTLTGQESIVGIWKTIDDESGEERSQMKIYEKDGILYGRVVKMYPSATIKTCQGCAGDMNGKSLLDIDIIRGLKPYKDYYSYGIFTDPKGGREYKLNMTREGNTLKVRGYIGMPMLGRTQTWHLVQEY